MLADADIAAIAGELDAAERSRTQIPLISGRFPEADMADAYRIQDRWVALKDAAGRKRIGWKIGLTSRAMQAALQINTPDSGILFDDMRFQDGDAVPEDRFIQPRVEAEIAFVLKAPLRGAEVTVCDVLNATDYILPALEILDTRVQRQDPQTGAMRNIIDTIADNAANAGIVTGGRPMRPLDADLRWMGAIVSRNAVVEETGLGAGVLNHPAMGIVWLVRRLHSLGAGLVAGEVVLSGSFIRPIETRHGDTITADFGKAGTVSVHFR
ncbi:2-oxo-hept-4-ene-1,7-dioate hydratase [Stappia indica]|uniref:2-oxo-hept-4-ene-1,7-dioate hydratase n=1 Tax=Stappia indica TaxID=538381 RepID=UPI001CD274E9|nr:2-oxo-hepta-3-ene-1,7-dioic acid hydratase [Stappia indica]MCA1298091.1 2-oxo-hepta-3-ene-1,7-dioic acid hydratase [Stappia indica]